MSRTIRNRKGLEFWFKDDDPEWVKVRDWRSCWCCSQKRQRKSGGELKKKYRFDWVKDFKENT